MSVDKLEQLRKFAAFERDNNAHPAGFQHITEWAVARIEELEAENEQLRKDVERKPMTDEDILRIYGLSKSTTDFARNIESFITKGTP